MDKTKKIFVKKVEWKWKARNKPFINTFTHPVYVIVIIFYLTVIAGSLELYLKLIGVCTAYIIWYLLDIFPIPKRIIYYEEL